MIEHQIGKGICDYQLAGYKHDQDFFFFFQRDVTYKQVKTDLKQTEKF